MRKLWILTRVQLRAMLATFSLGDRKKHAAGGAVAMLFIGGLAMYLSGIYSFLFGAQLSEIGAMDLLVPLMGVMAAFMALMFTVNAASGIVFSNRDSELLLALPVPAFAVVLSKLLALYLENLLFIGVWMIPTAVVNILYGASPLIILWLAVIVLFLPLLSSLIGLLVGLLVAVFSARSKYKTLLANIAYFVFFALIMVLSFQVSALINRLVENTDGLRQALDGPLFIFGWMMRGAQGELLYLLLFCIVCLAPFLFVTYLISTQYKRLLGALQSHTLRKDYKLDKVSARSPFRALLQKEADRFFGTPIYLFNTGMGFVLLLLAAGYLLFAHKSVTGMITMMEEMLGAALPVGAIVCAGMCCMLSVCCTTCVSVSLEGKTLWILREAPVSARLLFGAKAGFNIFIGLPCIALVLAVIAPLYGLSLSDTVISLLASVLVLTHTALFGLCVNLCFPKMDGASDALVVKQSASAALGVLGTMVLVGVLVAGYFFIGAALGFVVYALCACALLAVLCTLEWLWILHGGVRRLRSL